MSGEIMCDTEAVLPDPRDLQEIFTGREVTFTIHGERYTVQATDEVTPQTTLNSYLRNILGLKGTKAMCYEGGCGACVVAATVKHPLTKQERTYAVNSCLIPVLSCEGWDIHTLEELGNRKDGYHKIQETLAKFHGSQCGYCSGGMIMNMYALTESNDKLTMKQIENAFGGNLCRCTGYRPIMAAFKSLASDADPSLLDKYPDIEDIKICSKTGKQCSDKCKPLEKKPIAMSFKANDNWYKVYSVTELVKLFYTIENKTYRLAAGNTGKGVYKITKPPEVWIDVSFVHEFLTHYIGTKLEIGGNVSLTDTMEILIKAADQKAGFWHLRKVHKHLDLVANVPVRNTGTIAGNLSLKHTHNEFPSDVFLLLETIGATLKIVQKSGFSITKTLVDYLKFDMNKCAIQTIIIPQYAQDKYLFESYKICPRVQNAHAYINAGFLVKHDGKFNVKSARIVFGGINPEFIHAKNTEAYLVGKNLIDNTTIQGALAKLNDELKPDHVLPDASPEFRKNLTMSLYYKFVLASAPKDKVNPLYQSGGARLERELSTGTQIYQTHEELYPLTQPVVKLEAMIQCSGEAQYVNDTPPIPGELFGVFVLAEAKPLSLIKSVDTSAALAIPGVKAFITYKDIPGINSFTPAAISPTAEQLFCENKILYNGQALGLILAENQGLAYAGAAAVKVTYEATQDIPAFNIDDIRKNKQEWRITNAVKIEPKRKGDDIKHVLKGKFQVDAQYHFTMETQSCICIPTDDGGLDLLSATQWMDNVQMAAAKALNIPMNKINVTVKRLGGAYGAKILRANLVSTACAIAAYKMNKPVRIQLPIDTNMKMVGKRVPTVFEYELGTNDNGVIQYLNSTYYQNHALSGVNESLAGEIANFAQNMYLNDTWKWDGNSINTNLPGNGYARAPGTTEAIGMIESVMEHIAYTVNKDPIDVKLANLQPTEETMPAFVKDMITWSEYEQRKKAVEEFNSKNRWMKKGISMVIMNYPFVLYGPYSVFVSVYAGDGTVAISHGGIECGQGINTKIAQVCAYTLGIPLDMVSIKASNSLNAPNNFATAGSVTSEGVCYAVIRACREIQRRLEPVKENMANPTWPELILQASRESVELCATHMFSAKSDIKPYPIYGLCVSEVEVDLLTGEHNITRVDLIEDVGQSMSPEIDVGQIEGAFVMGLGYYTCENLIYDENGACLTNSTWTYKIPGVKDIPADFRVKFRQDSTNPDGVLNSKALSEPPLCLAVSIPLAIRRALASARGDADPNADKFIPLVGPTTVEVTHQNAKNDYKKYTL